MLDFPLRQSTDFLLHPLDNHSPDERLQTSGMPHLAPMSNASSAAHLSARVLRFASSSEPAESCFYVKSAFRKISEAIHSTQSAEKAMYCGPILMNDCLQ